MGAIVPGQLRKLETVFEVVGLQVLGISSVKSDTDQWLIDSCVKCKKAAPCEAGCTFKSPRACTRVLTQQGMQSVKYLYMTNPFL